MALDIGRLVGYLDLDDKKFESALGGLEGKISGKKAVFAGAALLVGGAVAAALGQGLANAMDMNEAGAKLSAQLDLTKDQSATAGKVAGELYANNYGDSIEQVNSAVGDVMGSIDGMKDANARTVEAMTGKLLNLQKAFEIDTARSAAVAGQMVKAGLVDNADEAVDLLTASLQKVPPAMRENIVDAIDEYGPFFDQLGFKGQEAMNALVKGAEKGQYGIDKAGDAIKEFSIRATDLGDTNAQQALKDLGLSGTDMADQLLAGGDSAFGATQKIVQGLLNVKDPGKQAQLATSLFGTQLEDLNKGQIADFLGSLNGTSDALGNTAGAAEKMGQKLNSGAATSIDSVTRSFEGMMTNAITPLLPGLASVFKFFTDNPAILTTLAVAAGVLALAFVGITIATWAMNTALLANPITWIVLAVVAAIALLTFAVVAIVKNWDSIVGWITGVFGAVWGWLQGVIQGFADWWNSTMAAIGAAIVNGWNNTINWLKGIPGWIGGVFAAAGQWLVNAGKALFQGWYQGNLLMWATVWGFITSIGSRILGALAAAGSWLISTGRNLLSGMYSGITAGWAMVWGFITGIQGRVLGALSGAIGWLIGTGRNVLSGMYNGITGFWGTISSWIGGIGGRVLAGIGNLARTLYSAGGDLMRGLLQGIQGGLSNILGAIAGMAGDIMGKFKSVLGIASPSKVFRGYGKNIGEGLLLGLADLQPEVAMGIQAMANLQPSSATAYTYSNSYRGQTTLYVDKMGYDPEEIVDVIERRQQETEESMQLDTLRVGL